MLATCKQYSSPYNVSGAIDCNNIVCTSDSGVPATYALKEQNVVVRQLNQRSELLSRLKDLKATRQVLWERLDEDERLFKVKIQTRDGFWGLNKELQVTITYNHELDSLQTFKHEGVVWLLRINCCKEPNIIDQLAYLSPFHCSKRCTKAFSSLSGGILINKKCAI